MSGKQHPPEVRRDIIARAMRRDEPLKIARETGLPASYVQGVLSAARKRGVELPRFNTRARRDVTKRRLACHEDAANAFLALAHARAEDPADLLTRLVIAIARDDLVDAILDEGETDA